MPRKKSNDIMWADLNSRLLLAIQRNDWTEIKKVYYDQALLLKKEGRDSFRFLEESLKSELYKIQNQDLDKNIEQLEFIASVDSCQICRSFNGRVFSTDEVLAQRPIPIVNCARGSCRCSYAPVVQVIFERPDNCCT